MERIQDARGLNASPSSSSYRQFVSSLISELALALAASDSASSLNPLANTDQRVKNALLTLHALFPNELLPALDILDRRLALRCTLKETASQDEATSTSQDRSKRRRLDDTNLEGISNTNAIVDADQARYSTTHHVVQSSHQEDSPLLEGEGQSTTQSASLVSSNNVSDNQTGIETNAKTHVNVVQRAAKPISMLYYIRSGRQLANKLKWRDAIAETTAHYEVRLKAWSCSCPAFAFSAFSTSTRQLTQSHGRGKWQIGGISLGDDLPICKHILACTLVEQCPQLSQFVEDMNVTTNDLAGWAAGYGD